MRDFAHALALCLTLLAGACAREPLDCNSIHAGDLAISELRGKQSGEDTLGQWIELRNASGLTVALDGLVLRLMRLNGASAESIMIRLRGLAVAPEGHVVLGRFAADGLPAHVNYGFGAESDLELYSDGVLELHACSALVDRIVYRDLPGAGSLAFDGAIPLTAESNDDQRRWCVDPGEPVDGFPGTPGEDNRPCE